MAYDVELVSNYVLALKYEYYRRSRREAEKDSKGSEEPRLHSLNSCRIWVIDQAIDYDGSR
jgi:hypothetical protein